LSEAFYGYNRIPSMFFYTNFYGKFITAGSFNEKIVRIELLIKRSSETCLSHPEKGLKAVQDYF